MNWIRGRGYEVHVECVVPSTILQEVLHTTAQSITELNLKKNYLGSAVAGTLGGNNAHAANIVAGLYVATGQDVAHIGTSSMSMVQTEVVGDDLQIGVRLPCMELATLGGGTMLSPQREYLGMMLAGAQDRSACLASIVGASVLAGELNLLAALSTSELVSAHLRLNRKG